MSIPGAEVQVPNMRLHGYDLEGFSQHCELFQQLHRKGRGKLGFIVAASAFCVPPPVQYDCRPSTIRRQPCPHFGTCGGCTLQHWQDAAYIAHKCDQLATSLRRAGFTDVALSPPVRTGPGERRRMDLAARRTRSGVVLGLHRERSTDVVDLTTCLVLRPELVALMPPLRILLTRLQALHREGSVIANLLDSGPDMLLRTDAPLQLADRIALTEFARAHALPRIAWAQGTDDPEPVAILRPPTTSLCGHHDHTATWRLPASFGIGRGSHRRGGTRCASPQGTHRGTVRRLRHDHLRTGGACPRRRMGRRCGVGIRAAHRRQQSRPRGPHRSDAARPRATAAAGKGTQRLCRGRSGSAVRRRCLPGRSRSPRRKCRWSFMSAAIPPRCHATRGRCIRPATT